MNTARRRAVFPWAILPRSAALFIVLYQLRLLAGELADTPVFTGTLLFAFAAAALLARRGLRPREALPTLALVPWAARLLLALPRFLPGGDALERAIPLDSLLLNLDRNNFVALLPFYWAAGTTYFSLRSRRFLRADIVAAGVLLLVIFCFARTAEMDAYRWPVLTIGLFTGLLFLQILSLVLSLPPEFRARKAEALPAALFLFLLIAGAGFLFIRPSQEKAVDRGGGLLEPKLFRFDFSQFLRLESEISMNEDLVFIMKKEAGDSHTLLRRYVLSGYEPGKGFFRRDEWDEKSHPARLPGRKTERETEEVKTTRRAGQEYYLVNFDPAAFIALKEPALITPFETWDDSSFSSVYRVESVCGEALPYELYDAGDRDRYSPAELGLSIEEYAWYTACGGGGEIAALAKEITGSGGSYWNQVRKVYEWLKFGDFRYSLKPGIAPDGDQLGHFLFQSKKGYCSYYAFSMALLLRSLGIPARVAAGFFIDPQTTVFDYYPVRANMAHAWVEVRFPEYGWIEYDPTTQILAEGEEFRFTSGLPETFEGLMKEILDHHSRLVPREGSGEEAPPGLAAWTRETLGFLRRFAPLLAALLWLLASLGLRTGPLLRSALDRRPRRGAARLWDHALRRLALAGYRRRGLETEAEWAKKLEPRFGGLYALYQGAAEARFAPDYGAGRFRVMGERYRAFAESCRRGTPRWRRALGWIAPFLALLLPGGAGLEGPGRRGAGAAAVFLLLMALAGDGGGAQDRPPEDPAADGLFERALDAQGGEFWERAVGLYSQGSALFPGDSRFPLALGDLYYRRELYRLAWEEYRKAEALLPEDPRLLHQLSRTTGKLNEDRRSVEYLERLVAADPDNWEAVDNLGWMYYKTHRLAEGERLLNAALERLGPDADFSMTLGTIYSAMFRYDEGKERYLEAIGTWELLKREIPKFREYAAVARYNLSILESRFYHFDRALEETNASLDSMNRASGRLAQGELYLRRMELSRAAAEYQEAYELDTSPLSKVNLAQVLQTGGHLEEGRVYAEDSLRAADLSWMINYGIDPVRYRRDLYEILYQTYRGLAKTEERVFHGTLGEKIHGLSRWAYSRFNAAVYRRLYRKYSLRAAEDYRRGSGAAGEESSLDALLQYYHAFKDYPRRARRYLDRAAALETALIPASAPSYRFEAAQLAGALDLLRELPAAFDPLWERDMIAKAAAELALKSPDRAERKEAAERLYGINPGALRRQGIRFPAELRIHGASPQTAAALGRLVKRTGMEPLPEGPEGAARFRLTMTVRTGAAGQSVLCEMRDQVRGTALFNRIIPLPSLSAAARSAFSRALGETVFSGFQR
jgi:predicted Zn-dependent protease